MSDLAIKVENIGKQYRINANTGAGKTFRETIMDLSKAPFKSKKGSNKNNLFWALEDISFEVKKGEILGVIGNNGAGKSTLLKILSRITEPTMGRAQIYGRIGSLLEVGTGFHSELTGRENIFLNGTILGMRKHEIKRRFDEIVDFAEIEQFLDTPVKRYSSGMYVRLAFAVAAHLDPEILLIDEVLAVGDIDFQKKCVGSMQSVAKSGRTVLVVSHNMGLIESLCGSALLLNHGKIQSYGATHEVVADYIIKSGETSLVNLLDRVRTNSNSHAKFASAQIITDTGSDSQIIKMGEGLKLKLKIISDQPIQKPWIGIQIRTQYNQLLFHMGSREAGYELQTLRGINYILCHIDKLNLLPGRYIIDLILADMSNQHYDQVSSATYFDVRPADVLGTGMPMEKDYGSIYYPSRWKLSSEFGEDFRGAI